MSDREKLGKIGFAETPWLAKWTDKDEREYYELQARELYELYKDLRRESFRAHVDYGKWLIATMVAVHGGALFALNTIRGSSPDQSPATMDGLVSAASWHVAGIVLILFAGFFAWLNFQFAAAIYDKWAKPTMLQNLEEWPKDEARTDPITATLFLAGAAGLGSGYCLIVGALATLRAISSAG